MNTILKDRIGEGNHASRAFHHAVHHRRDPPFLQDLVLDLHENSVVDGPAPTSHRVCELRFAERRAAVQLPVQLLSGLEEFMNPLHLRISAEIAEAMLLVGDGIVVEKSLQADRLHIQDLAEKIERENQLPGDAEALPDLPGVKTGLDRSDFFRDVARGPAEKRVSPLLIPVGGALGRSRVIHHK